MSDMAGNAASAAGAAEIQTSFSSASVNAMVTDEPAEESFVRTDLLSLSQFELDRSSRAECVAVIFTSRIRISGCDTHAVGLGVICA
ncbi:MAG TPA: hypothetical protein VN827_09005, partial [Chthoniobacterales bacterium]|nr:hypothetical protein [Chthoniobacterales bacterium]